MADSPLALLELSLFYREYSNIFIICNNLIFPYKRIKMLHTWLAEGCRHHGPRAVPHTAASQQQSPRLTANAAVYQNVSLGIIDQLLMS